MAGRESESKAKRKRRREWAEDPETFDRINSADVEAEKRVESEPWAAVGLAQVAVEILIASMVHALTEHQEPALRDWIEGLRVDTLSRDEEVRLVNALVAKSGRRIDGNEERWTAFRQHVKRRNDFLHRGLIPTVDDARASVAACNSIRLWLTLISARAVRRLHLRAPVRAVRGSAWSSGCWRGRCGRR